MFSDEVLQLSRAAIRKRYQFLPLWYTLFYEHEITGEPVMRPMLSQYPRDRNVLKLETQYMLGDKLLVAPVLDRSTTWVIVYFPSTDGNKDGDVWYDIDTYERYDEVGTVGIKAPIDKLPVFQRGGTIIPKKLTVRKSSYYMRTDPFSLYVALDKNKTADGTLYYDDETSYDYQQMELYDYIHFHFTNNVLDVHPVKQNYKQIKFEKIHFAGLEGTPKQISLFCGSSNESTNLEIKSEGNLIYVDVKGIECGYNWSITLKSKSARNILANALMIVMGIIHAVKYFS